MLRRKDKLLGTDEARQLLGRAPFVHLAGLGTDGLPLLRTVNAVLWRGDLAFHGAMAGEKLALLDQPVVAQVEEPLVTIPSVWQHPERACPATTWFRSAQVRGRLVSVDAMDEKAEILNLIMRRFQPEGGYRPITAEDPMYAGVLRSLLLARVQTEEISGKHAVGQNLAPAARRSVLDGLWRRGEPKDLVAIDACRAAAPADEEPPPWLAAPEGARLRVSLQEAELPAVLDLIRDQYWNPSFTDPELARAHRLSSARIGAEDAEGRLIATARAVADGTKLAWIADVVVAPDWRGRGLGRALMTALLDHPAVRGARWVGLKTRDAQRFYASFGFRERERIGERSEMILLRG